MTTPDMRQEFMAWVADCGCDTDGAWSAWQAAWNRRAEHVAAASTDTTPTFDGDTDALAQAVARAALLWVLWHHQGGSSPTGQAVRFALGMGQFDRLTPDQVAQAKAWAPGIPGLAHTDPSGVEGSKPWA